MSHENFLRSLPESERPRERLFRLGAAALSTAELLAVLLRTGGAGRDVLTLSADLLAEVGGPGGLGALGVEELCRRPGLGPAKAASLAAAVELGRRAAESDMMSTSLLDRPEAAGRYLVARLRGRPTEVFGYLALNGRHRLLQVRELSVGTKRQAPVDAAELFRRALVDGASGVLLFHNHPSGTLEASADDRRLTRRLVAAGSTVGVPVLDHLVIADARWLSLRTGAPELFADGGCGMMSGGGD